METLTKIKKLYDISYSLTDNMYNDIIIMVGVKKEVISNELIWKYLDDIIARNRKINSIMLEEFNIYFNILNKLSVERFNNFLFSCYSTNNTKVQNKIIYPAVSAFFQLKNEIKK